MPLHLNATPIAPARARGRSLDADRSAAIDTGQELAYVLRGNHPGNRRHRPVGDDWNGGGQRGLSKSLPEWVT
jgi:hypothetical protein